MLKTVRDLEAVVLALLTTSSHAFAEPRAPAAEKPSAAREPRVDYTLSARLDADRHVVSGSGRIRFESASRGATSELYFHLYLNAFENQETLFLRGPLSGGRSGGLSGHPGKIEVTRLTSPRFPGRDLWELRDRHSPGDDRDTTDIRVPLPEALAPGEVLELDVEFVSELPEVIERTGYAGDFHLVAQWFPKLAKQEPDGRWAHFAFHPFAEFYANFGDYRIVLDVPDEHVVGSTGDLVEIERKDGRKRYRAHAAQVHDFAWTSWPGFEIERRTIGAVRVTLMAPPGGPRARATTWATLEHALPTFRRAYGEYPYPTLTVVRPPRNAERAGGMEYPTFLTIGGSDVHALVGLRSIELVTAHELAHQWFQGLVASNEAEYPFLDEGLTSYAEFDLLDDWLGAGSLVELGPLRISRRAASRYVGLRLGAEEPISLPAREFSSFGSIASQVYGRTTLALETLGRVHGTERLARALHGYTARERFRHPTPERLAEAIELDLGANARELFETMVHGRGTVDFRVEGLLGGKKPPREPDAPRESRFRVLRAGNLALPVDVRVTFDDGSERSFRLPDPKPIEVIELRHTAAIRRIEVDPERKIVLDENLWNNRFEPSRRGAEAVRRRALLFLELAERLLRP